MPPAGSASLSGKPASSSNDDVLPDDILVALKAHQDKTAKRHRQKQQSLANQAGKLTKEYKERVGEVLREADEAVQKRIEEYQKEEERLFKEVAKTEKELLELLQVESSGVQLSAAAIQADIEDNKADNRATLEGLEELGLQEAKGIDAAIDALWMKEEGEGNDDGGEGTV